MKRLEVRLYIDVNENQTSTDDVIFHLEKEIDDIIGAVVKRTDLLQEFDLSPKTNEEEVA